VEDNVHAGEIWRMRAELDTAPRQPLWPEGFDVHDWRDADALEVHALLVDAYRHGGGEVADYEVWRPWFTGDPEFDAAACRLARSDEGELAGVLLCWSSAFIKDLGVAERFRRRGLGEALVREALCLFHARKAAAVELKVQADNPSRAWALYERLGFRVVERLAS
jgi:ribosomal protein S18 acetylase RimI-like enzyme